MTDLNDLRVIAKRIARAKRIPHHQALEIVAAGCDQPHWNALTKAWTDGWRPSVSQMDGLTEPRDLEATSRSVAAVEASSGIVSGVPYELEIGFDYAAVYVKGSWSVFMGHAPNEPATIEKYVTPNPLDDEAFLKEVMKVAHAAADRVREAISSDWPRRATKPDAEGRAAHPLFGHLSAEWHCLHCDVKSTGAQMAANMWHCPKCGATPIDMHPFAWWKEPLPVD